MGLPKIIVGFHELAELIFNGYVRYESRVCLLFVVVVVVVVFFSTKLSRTLQILFKRLEVQICF